MRLNRRLGAFRSYLLDVDVLPISNTPPGYQILTRLPCETHRWLYRVATPKHRTLIYFWRTENYA